jgi:hypothetical protein
LCSICREPHGVCLDPAARVDHELRVKGLTV